MASDAERITLAKIGLDLTELNQAVQQASQNIAGMGKKIEDSLKSSGDAAAKESKRMADSLDQTVMSDIGTRLEDIFSNISDSIVKFISSSVDVARSFHTLSLRLTSIYQDGKKAADMFAYVKDMAIKTPFEVKGLTEAAVTMASYGQDAKKYLPLVGDLASAMGRNVTEASAAVSKALAGSAEGFEILQNSFGITKVQLKAFGAEVDRTGQLSLSSVQSLEKAKNALTSLMATKYSGAMDKQMETFDGVISNINDSLNNFKQQLGNDLLPALKGVSKVVLEYVDGLSNMPAVHKGALLAVAGLTVGFTQAASAIANMLPLLQPLYQNMGSIFTSLTGITGQSFFKQFFIRSASSGWAHFMGGLQSQVIQLGYAWAALDARARASIIGVGAFAAAGAIIYGIGSKIISNMEEENKEAEKKLKREEQVAEALRSIKKEKQDVAEWDSKQVKTEADYKDRLANLIILRDTLSKAEKVAPAVTDADIAALRALNLQLYEAEKKIAAVENMLNRFGVLTQRIKDLGERGAKNASFEKEEELGWKTKQELVKAYADAVKEAYSIYKESVALGDPAKIAPSRAAWVDAVTKLRDINRTVFDDKEKWFEREKQRRKVSIAEEIFFYLKMALLAKNDKDKREEYELKIAALAKQKDEERVKSAFDAFQKMTDAQQKFFSLKKGLNEMNEAEELAYWDRASKRLEEWYKQNWAWLAKDKEKMDQFNAAKQVVDTNRTQAQKTKDKTRQGLSDDLEMKRLPTDEAREKLAVDREYESDIAKNSKNRDLAKEKHDLADAEIAKKNAAGVKALTDQAEMGEQPTEAAKKKLEIERNYLEGSKTNAVVAAKLRKQELAVIAEEDRKRNEQQHIENLQLQGEETHAALDSLRLQVEEKAKAAGYSVAIAQWEALEKKKIYEEEKKKNFDSAMALANKTSSDRTTTGEKKLSAASEDPTLKRKILNEMVSDYQKSLDELNALEKDFNFKAMGKEGDQKYTDFIARRTALEEGLAATRTKLTQETEKTEDEAVDNRLKKQEHFYRITEILNGNSLKQQIDGINNVLLTETMSIQKRKQLNETVRGLQAKAVENAVSAAKSLKEKLFEMDNGELANTVLKLRKEVDEYRRAADTIDTKSKDSAKVKKDILDDLTRYETSSMKKILDDIDRQIKNLKAQMSGATEPQGEEKEKSPMETMEQMMKRLGKLLHSRLNDEDIQKKIEDLEDQRTKAVNTINGPNPIDTTGISKGVGANKENEKKLGPHPLQGANPAGTSQTFTGNITIMVQDIIGKAPAKVAAAAKELTSAVTEYVTSAAIERFTTATSIG